MTRIEREPSGLGEHVDWSLHRPQMAIGMGALSEAVYGHSELPLREREAARYTIAMINDCKVCTATRAKDASSADLDEPFYAWVADRRGRGAEHLTAREALAAEFAERFALDHLALTDDDAFWARLRTEYGDAELADLTICCGAWLGMGRMIAVMGAAAPAEQLLV